MSSKYIVFFLHIQTVFSPLVSLVSRGWQAGGGFLILIPQALSQGREFVVSLLYFSNSLKFKNVAHDLKSKVLHIYIQNCSANALIVSVSDPVVGEGGARNIKSLQPLLLAILFMNSYKPLAPLSLLLGISENIFTARVMSGKDNVFNRVCLSTVEGETPV